MAHVGKNFVFILKLQADKVHKTNSCLDKNEKA